MLIQAGTKPLSQEVFIDVTLAQNEGFIPDAKSKSALQYAGKVKATISLYHPQENFWHALFLDSTEMNSVEDPGGCLCECDRYTFRIGFISHQAPQSQSYEVEFVDCDHSILRIRTSKSVSFVELTGTKSQRFRRYIQAIREKARQQIRNRI